MPKTRCPRPARRRRLGWGCSLSLALLAPGAHPAVFVPGAPPDPPTGDLAVTPLTAAEPLRAPGFQWVLGPWRQAGSLSVDGRWLRFEDGRHSRQGLMVADVEWANHLWQPWFAQMRFGLGLLGVREAGSGGERDATGSSGGGSGGLTGRLSLSLFPASRFPFELRADVGDNRSTGDALGGDLRTERLSLSQSWRPEAGNTSLHLQVDHSRLRSADSRDTLSSLQANAEHQAGEHSLDLGLNFSLNERTDTGEHSRLSSLNARHGFHPSADLQVDNLASWNEQRLGGGPLGAQELGSDVRQLSSVATWRPREGEPLYSARMPLQLVGTARWVQARVLGVVDGPQAQALSATVGANLDVTRDWRLAAALAFSRVDGGASTVATTSANVSGSWTPVSLPLGAWRYAPSAVLNGGISQGGEDGRRQLAGLQAAHSLSRDWTLGAAQQLALNLTQSAGVLHESQAVAPARALAHSLGLFWQGAGDGEGGGGGGQRYASLSYNDTRTRAAGDGSFQLVNLQLSQRMLVSRQTSWSVNITLQASRNQSTEVDVFSGERRRQDPGWQRFYSGGASLEQQRLFGIPRLRHTLQLNLNSQQIERRVLGDIDAPTERVTQSLESRVDYAIGRLDLRLSARVARVDERTVAAVVARLQRRF